MLQLRHFQWRNLYAEGQNQRFPHSIPPPNDLSGVVGQLCPHILSLMSFATLAFVRLDNRDVWNPCPQSSFVERLSWERVPWRRLVGRHPRGRLGFVSPTKRRRRPVLGTESQELIDVCILPTGWKADKGFLRFKKASYGAIVRI
jgi:hypothetical protein